MDDKYYTVVVNRDSHFYNQLKSLRYTEAMTQQELAKELGVTQQTLSAYEKGTIVPSLFMLN